MVKDFEVTTWKNRQYDQKPLELQNEAQKGRALAKDHGTDLIWSWRDKCSLKITARYDSPQRWPYKLGGRRPQEVRDQDEMQAGPYWLL